MSQWQSEDLQGTSLGAASCQVTMSAAKTVTARFSRP
jgi:hypothetical protein